MSRSHTRRLVGTAPAVLLILAGCSDPPTALAPAELPTALETELPLSAPMLQPSDLVHTEVVSEGEPTTNGPMLSTRGTDVAEIYNEVTRVGILYGNEAYAEGKHEYTGSVGRVDTNLHIEWEAKYLASASATRQRSDWLSLSVRKTVWAYARAQVDKTCGLRLTGNSMHRAWWSYFRITGTTTYGEAIRSSSADPFSQSPCGKKIDGNDPTGEYREGGGISCTYLITYDIDTGEVVDVDLLSCQSGGVLI